MMNYVYNLGIYVTPLFRFLSPIIPQLDFVGSIQYDPVLFDSIPASRIISGNMI